MKKMLLLFFSLVLLTSCSQDENGFIPAEEGNTNASHLSVTIPAFTPADGTRSTVNTDYTCSWQAGDKIGMFAHRMGTETTNASQVCFVLSDGAGSNTATFTGGIGWKMSVSGMYQYVAYFPYNEINADEKINLIYNGQTQAVNGSTADLGKFDFMFSNMTAPSAPEQANFELKHINALLNLELAVPEAYQDRTFTKVVLTSEDENKIFTDTAVYSVALQDIQTIHTTNTLEFSLGEEGQGFKVDGEGKLNIYMMMPPISLEDKEIKVELWAKYDQIPVLEGSFTSTNLESSTISTIDVNNFVKSSRILPPAPKDGEPLHILLFGHSFGDNCFAYLPEIMVTAGVMSVHYGRFYQGNCSMNTHLDHWNARDTYDYYNYEAGSINVKRDSCSSQSVIDKWPWDIIIFQTNISSTGEGNYNSYKASFKTMANEVIARCKEKHHKTPIIGWNMFWSFNTPRPYTEEDGSISSIDHNATEEYNSIVNATQEMMADEEKGFDVKLIVPTGTAMQNARVTSLNDGTTCQLFTRDGSHASNGIGRYVTAATWFQTIIAPIYGKTVVGNPFRPTSSSGTWDVVDDAKATILQKCAVEAAKHPFEVTKIEE